MYSLSIHFGRNAMVWQFLFREEKKAGKMSNAYLSYRTNKFDEQREDTLIGTDDFGKIYAIPFKEISGMMIEDLDLLEEARIKRSLSNARGQAKYNERAKTDPMIRTLTRQQPSMLTPFNNRQLGSG